jgi:hypothetical protein
VKIPSLLLSFVLCLAGLAAPEDAGAAPWPPKRGDLIIGFQAARGLGSDYNVFYHLGPAHEWRDAPDGWREVGTIGEELSRYFGEGWFERTDLWCGAVANLSNLKSEPAKHGDPPRTFYLSRPAKEPGLSVPWSGLTEMALGSAATFISGQYEMLARRTATPGQAAVLAYTDVIDWQNGWTYWNPLDARGPLPAYRRFPGGIQQHFGQRGAGPVHLDIQRVEPGEEKGKVVFTIAIDSAGRLTIGRGPRP